MYKGATILGLIIARGGSKGLPSKNTRLLGGKPLIAWSIAAAKSSELLDRCVLSSDDDGIIAVAREHGCEVPFRRPAELAADETTAAAVVCHALEQVQGYDYVVLLQATSPARQGPDIDAAIRTCIDAKANSCVSVCEPAKSPYWMYQVDEANRLMPLFPDEHDTPRRQELPPTYVLNGAVYVVNTTAMLEHEQFVFGDTVAYVMPRERSLDIDSDAELVLAETLLSSD